MARKNVTAIGREFFMQSVLVNFKRLALMLSTVLFVFGVQGVSDGQNLTLSVSPQQLSEAALDEGVVTLSLQGGTYVGLRWDIADALTVSGIPGVTIGTFGPAWFGVERVSDTEIEVKLGFDGDIDTDSKLTFTVSAGAIEAYEGTALTAQVSVAVSAEQVPERDAPDPPQQETEDTSDTLEYIQGPWLWMIAEGSDIDTDYLELLSDGEINEAMVSQEGIAEGETLGEFRWTRGRIQPSTHCGFLLCASNNVQHVVNATGLSTVQNLSHHTAYAFINVVSPHDQNNVRMGVGSDDAVKVWLNGTVVHRKRTSRRTTGIQDRFDTNLKAGNNLLLVKVSEYWGNWGLFFKIYLDGTNFTTSTTVRNLSTNNRPAADVNEDGKIDIHDLILVIRALGQTAPVNPRVDVNNDGRVDKTDLLIIVENLDDSAIPAAPAAMLATLDPATLRVWIDVLHAEADNAIAYRKTLAILRGLLATVLPQETTLLANYPNPFNPETWIPYHLAKDADVTLHIYAVNGTLVRTLTLGHQAAGMYQNRSRAAYWDGKNAFGEPVASGIYFYTLTAGDFTATRKMLIRK